MQEERPIFLGLGFLSSWILEGFSSSSSSSTSHDDKDYRQKKKKGIYKVENKVGNLDKRRGEKINVS